MNLIWLSDIHLNFLDRNARQRFYEFISISRADAILISGDIAEAPSVSDLLKEMSKAISRPIYFVLGNHDYYFGEVEVVRKEMRELSQNLTLVHWLPAENPILLNNRNYLVGQDGWADGRNGDFFKSPIELNDSRLIVDLFIEASGSKKRLLAAMQQLADKDAHQLKIKLIAAADLGAEQILVLTHVPPFKENCFYRGRQTSDEFLPFYSSQATGQVLKETAGQYPQIQFQVLCGHTHAKSLYNPLKNLLIKSGQAEYYMPEIQEVICL